jgi:hypothetical protein
MNCDKSGANSDSETGAAGIADLKGCAKPAYRPIGRSAENHAAALDAGGLVYDIPSPEFWIGNTNRKSHGKEVYKENDEATRSRSGGDEV